MRSGVVDLARSFALWLSLETKTQSPPPASTDTGFSRRSPAANALWRETRERECVLRSSDQLVDARIEPLTRHTSKAACRSVWGTDEWKSL